MSLISSVFIKRDAILQSINNTKWCGREYPTLSEEGVFVFWIEGKSVQFQTTYCVTCGNYNVARALEIIPKIRCNCRRI